MNMIINKSINNGELLLEIEGSIDTTTAPTLEKELDNSLSGINSLILDFAKVRYISSAGLRILLVTYKTMSEQGKLVLRHVNQNVMDILEMTGFSNILTIEQ